MSGQIIPFQRQARPLIVPREEWDMLGRQAVVAFKSGLLPRFVDSQEKALIIALKGNELGIPMMQSFAHISVIQAKPCIGAELMLALIFRAFPNAKIQYVETTATRCIIRAARPGGEYSTFEFTIEEATNAKLTSKDSWKNYPSTMLRWRAVSMMARAMFPDCLMGCSYTPEEMGADVNEEGEIVDITPPPPPPPPPEQKTEAPAAKEAAPQTSGNAAPPPKPAPNVWNGEDNHTKQNMQDILDAKRIPAKHHAEVFKRMVGRRIDEFQRTINEVVTATPAPAPTAAAMTVAPAEDFEIPFGGSVQ